jgi:hypothetical protein
MKTAIITHLDPEAMFSGVHMVVTPQDVFVGILLTLVLLGVVIEGIVLIVKSVIKNRRNKRG